MVDEATALAMAGATTVVAAMATTAWDSTRDAVVRMFRSRETAEQHTVQGQLTAHDHLVRQTEDTEQVRQILLPVWGQQLETFLSRHPDAAGDLSALIARTRNELPRAEQAWVVQNITASAPRSTAFGTIHGNVIQHNHYGSPTEATSAETAPEGESEDEAEGDDGARTPEGSA
ncbi:hypothetical protein [Streptomyces sp. NBC_01294]|uniref:hypothetical protein n=1 Tax=Streptomyces sp. NBC_01294 TaxID=2903815 RepID=UPI002DD9C805|nr:hypothetical protein [Streptomyces sp. NBC_01294]WRZ56210.1 hypothetical protein OG534_06850 [Streptomyces sp. NBC_01294]